MYRKTERFAGLVRDNLLIIGRMGDFYGFCGILVPDTIKLLLSI